MSSITIIRSHALNKGRNLIIIESNSSTGLTGNNRLTGEATLRRQQRINTGRTRITKASTNSIVRLIRNRRLSSTPRTPINNQSTLSTRPTMHLNVTSLMRTHSSTQSTVNLSKSTNSSSIHLIEDNTNSSNTYAVSTNNDGSLAIRSSTHSNLTTGHKTRHLRSLKILISNTSLMTLPIRLTDRTHTRTTRSCSSGFRLCLFSNTYLVTAPLQSV